MLISLPTLLIIVGLIAFIVTALFVSKFLNTQAILLKKERLKSRIGLANHYKKDNRPLGRQCWWCTVGLSLGPKKSEELTIIHRQLVSAGYRRNTDLGGYFFIKYSSILTSGLISALLWSWLNTSPIWMVIVPVVVMLLPERILIYLGNRRLAKISDHLPDFLDMCNICMNAGLSYLVALKRVSKELKDIHPQICYEFEYLLHQIQLGVPRADALLQFAARNPTKDIENLVQVLVQNEKLGSSLTEAINQFSRRMYETRQEMMEEKAAKTSAKMAVVIMPFLMVPYLILLLGEKIVMLGRSF
jgi:tight adherence protein C